MKYKYTIAIIGSTSWGGLGFIRGVNSYKYTQEKSYKKEAYLYTSSVMHGFVGSLMYVNPIFLPFFIYKEIYRLEANIRDLELEKNSRYYNELI